MTYLLTAWTFLLVAIEGVAGCFDDNGSFTCAQKWYFWLPLFAGLLLLFFIIACLCNHYCKKPHNAVATPRVLSAIERQKNRARSSVRPVSNSDTITDVQPANRQPEPLVNENWLPPLTNQTTSKGPTIYPNSTSVMVRQF